MSPMTITRRLAALAGAALMLGPLSLGLAGCGQGGDKAAEAPREIVFAILPTESQASSEPLWRPLLDDLSQAVGVPVKPFFASNYTVLVEAMRANHVQAAWFAPKTAIEAIDRAQGQVLARIVNLDGHDSYHALLIARKGSGVTLGDVLACGRRYDLGMGDPLSTSGTVAPMTFLFNPRGIVPEQCFKTVRSANHQANTFAVANGVVDVATGNTTDAVLIARGAPQIAAQIEEIWRSPPLPETGVVVRRDLDAALKDKIRAFLIAYGRGEGAEAERQRQVLAGLNYSGFNPADDSYLAPVREMIAAEARSGSPAAAPRETQP